MHLTCFGSAKALYRILGAENGGWLISSLSKKTDSRRGPHFSSPQSIPAGYTDLQVPIEQGCFSHLLCDIYTHRHNYSVHCAMIIVLGLFTAKMFVLAAALDTQQKKKNENIRPLKIKLLGC